MSWISPLSLGSGSSGGSRLTLQSGDSWITGISYPTDTRVTDVTLVTRVSSGTLRTGVTRAARDSIGPRKATVAHKALGTLGSIASRDTIKSVTSVGAGETRASRVATISVHTNTWDTWGSIGSSTPGCPWVTWCSVIAHSSLNAGHSTVSFYSDRSTTAILSWVTGTSRSARISGESLLSLRSCSSHSWIAGGARLTLQTLQSL